jgi:hypothetical protein
MFMKDQPFFILCLLARLSSESETELNLRNRRERQLANATDADDSSRTGSSSLQSYLFCSCALDDWKR